MKEIIVKVSHPEKLLKSIFVKQKMPKNFKGDVYVAVIPKKYKKYTFGTGDFMWREDNPIVEMYKEANAKIEAKKKLIAKLENGYPLSWKGYKNRNELYEKEKNSN